MDVSSLLESNFLTVDFVKSSQSKKGLILSPGSEEASQDGIRSLKLLVEIDGRQKYWKVNRVSLKNLVTAWGAKSEVYVGKRVSFVLAFVQGGREAVIGQVIQE